MLRVPVRQKRDIREKFELLKFRIPLFHWRVHHSMNIALLDRCAAEDKNEASGSSRV
jgi:hypothetical protein